MDAIKIKVNQQMGGYSFSITPSIRDFMGVYSELCQDLISTDSASKEKFSFGL